MLSSCRYACARSAEEEKEVDPEAQEVFNSPYAVTSFPEYAEVISYDADTPYDIDRSASESVKMLSAAAKEHGVWLFGGASHHSYWSPVDPTRRTGSIPERDAKDEKRLYNTATIYNPAGKLVAIHRKLHLFDIDVRPCHRYCLLSLMGRTDTWRHHLQGEHDPDWRRQGHNRRHRCAEVALNSTCHMRIFPQTLARSASVSATTCASLRWSPSQLDEVRSVGLLLTYYS